MRDRLVLRRATAAAAALVLGSAFPATAAVYPWNLPASVRIVQKDSTNARVFTTLQNAINSCGTMPGLSATKRCLVKVMPGVYNQVVAMRSFVDVEGSGNDTLLTSSAEINAGVWSNVEITTATVKMANDSEIRNLKIRNTSPFGGVGLLFNNVAGRALDVGVESENACTAASGKTCDSVGVLAEGVSATVTLTNVRARANHTAASPDTGNTISVGAFRGAQITAAGGGAYSHGGGYSTAYVCNVETGNGGSFEINNSVAEITLVNGGRVIDAGPNCPINLQNSVVRVLNCAQGNGKGIGGSSAVTVRNTEVWGCDCGINANPLHISTSLIAGACTYAPEIKIVNCWDQDFNPIPNQ